MNEVERIRAEYERRKRSIPPSRYSGAEPAPMLTRQGRERAVLGLLRTAGLIPLADRRILEVGCGGGQWLVDFETWGARRANLAGIDLIESRVRAAQARLAPTGSAGADIRIGDASDLPWDDGTFDIVLQSTMFSSILDRTMRTKAAAEMVRVLRPGGAILWYDLLVGNPQNRAARRISSAEVRALFPGLSFASRRVTVAPPLARLFARRAPLLVVLLEEARLLNTHLLAILRLPAAR
jgi:ubiquinone/menaquinone biosynthesis C-methylase UbiE